MADIFKTWLYFS